jgi:hypothetical protein
MDLFVSGGDAYHAYRIPTLVRSGKGTIHAFCEGRRHGAVMPWISSFGTTGIRKDLGTAKHCGDSAQYVDPGKDTYVLSNAASVVREAVSFHITRDGAEMWSSAQVVWLGPSAYLDLVCIDKGSVGCLVECGDERPYE